MKVLEEFVVDYSKSLEVFCKDFFVIVCMILSLKVFVYDCDYFVKFVCDVVFWLKSLLDLSYI